MSETNAAVRDEVVEGRVLKTEVVGTWSLIGCLVKGMEALGNECWDALNDKQSDFLSLFFDPGRKALTKGLISDEELKAIAASTASEINSWLARNGFQITLQEFEPGEFGVASIFRIWVEWLKRGHSITINNQGTKYPAARITEGVDFLISDSHPHPIARLTAKNNDVVYMTVVDDPPKHFALVEFAESLSRNAEECANFEDVIFPKIDLDVQPDISWIIGLQASSANGGRWEIGEAVQQVKLKMNEVGALVEEAAAMTMRSTSCRHPKPALVIDKPFLFWVERAGLARPMFTAFLCQDAWKDPGNIEVKPIVK